MPLDHYVSQVHLKKFYSPSLDGLMHAIRKSDLKSFTPNAQSVCRILDGSTNPYLQEDRAIEEFLKSIEPKYNHALEKLAAGSIDRVGVYTIAGFVAYVLVCSPAGMRLQSEPLKISVEETARNLDKQGLIPLPPSELGGQNLTELLNSEQVFVNIDPQYPQAMGISSIFSHITTFGNFIWEILQNPFDDSPFFTSDFPVAIERTNHPSIRNRVVPLSPNLAIRICPDPSLDTTQVDFSFSNFGYSTKWLSRKQVSAVNRTIVRCAEEIVFFRDNHDWVLNFIRKNSKYFIEPRTTSIPSEKGKLIITTLEVVEALK